MFPRQTKRTETGLGDVDSPIFDYAAIVTGMRCVFVGDLGKIVACACEDARCEMRDVRNTSEDLGALLDGAKMTYDGRIVRYSRRALGAACGIWKRAAWREAYRGQEGTTSYPHHLHMYAQLCLQMWSLNI